MPKDVAVTENSKFYKFLWVGDTWIQEPII
jgi:hypothetical protein